MERFKNNLRRVAYGWGAFIKWTLLAALTGAVVGGAAAAFHWCIGTVTGLRTLYPWLIGLLPVCGVAVVWLYKVCGMADDRGTNTVISAVRDNVSLRLRMAPLIFVSTVMTHLVGGSAGR